MTQQRFIAGAACPVCHAVDVIKATMEDGSILSAKCVDCGWESDKPPPPNAPTAPPTASDEIATVRILDPDKD